MIYLWGKVPNEEAEEINKVKVSKLNEQTLFI